MDFQAPRDHFTLDSAAAASVLNAWENAQRHALHPRSQMLYNNYGFPISPVSPSSSPQSSSAANAMLTLPGNAWVTPSSSMSSSELEMLHLHHHGGGREMIPASAAPASLADREPGFAGANQPNAAALFDDFDFTFAQNIPQLSLLPLQHHEQQEQHYLHRQQHQTCLTPPPPPPPPLPSLPTPLSPNNSSSSSSTFIASPPATPPNKAAFRRESSSPSSSKRSSEERETSTAASAKRPRQCMSVKDFVPPDVTGLSKREARLVKNRAAAFLSRQRKREEFELMEIRVAELERENARLREMAEGVSSSSPAPSPDSSELDLLRMQLASSRQREADLVHKFEVLKHETHKIKAEASEPSLNDEASSGSHSHTSTPGLPLLTNSKTGASLGLMALLCALPSLVSQSDFNSAVPSTAYPSSPDVSLPSKQNSTAAMMVDGACAAEERWQKLELGVEGDAETKLAGIGLGSLDVSFSTSSTKEGKIRLRIRSSSPSPSPSPSRPTSEVSKPVSACSTPDDVTNPTRLAALSLPSPAHSHSAPSPDSSPAAGDANNAPSFLFADSDVLAPFLGAGAGAAPSHSAASFDFGAVGTPFDLSSINPACIVSGQTHQQQHSARVRISLRSLPHPGGEGGEWEIEVR